MSGASQFSRTTTPTAKCELRHRTQGCSSYDENREFSYRMQGSSQPCNTMGTVGEGEGPFPLQTPGMSFPPIHSIVYYWRAHSSRACCRASSPMKLGPKGRAAGLDSPVDTKDAEAPSFPR